VEQAGTGRDCVLFGPPAPLATIDGTDLEFVVDLGQLKGRSIELGQFTSEVPAVQEALF
jgi:hypothetical protein